jgi:hypothetical protein
MQAILDKFQNAKKINVEHGQGTTSVEVLEGLNSNIRVKDLGRLQAATGDEYALLRGPTGDRVLIRGNVNTTAIPQKYLDEGYKFSGHSHPFSIQPSSADRAALRAFGQEQSIIVNTRGQSAPFGQYEDLSGWLP